MSKHTPGPWSLPHFANADSGCQCHCVFSESQSGFGCIAEIPWDGENENLQAATANSRLISAAPDLFAALESLLSKAYKQNFNDSYPEILAECEAAIAKARGES